MIKDYPTSFFYGFGLITLISVVSSIAFYSVIPILLPFVVLVAALTILDFKATFYLLLACIPISVDIDLVGGFATDLPTEPLMVGLMLVFLFYVLHSYQKLDKTFYNHPITTILFLHFSWILICAVMSDQFFVSFKFLLAKSWYLVCFYLIAGIVLTTKKNIQRAFWCVLIPLVSTVVIVLIRHSGYGFSFEKVSKVLSPFYINHVTYASILALFFPFVWFATTWYKRWSLIWWSLVGTILLFFVAIQLSYTRAAMLSIFIAAAAYGMVQFKLTRIVSLLSIIGALCLIIHLVSNNTYLEYAPNFEKTITHKKFDSLVEATAKGEDISTMERVYRWVAAAYMIKEKPFKGFGPGNFYSFYKRYTVSNFQTYVSHNPEKSGIHNYYLMILVEQGIIGFLVFMVLTFFALFKGEQIYHESTNKERKIIVMMALLCIIVIDALLLINDMLEIDKVGPFYFMSLAILVNMDNLNRREKRIEMSR